MREWPNVRSLPLSVVGPCQYCRCIAHSVCGVSSFENERRIHNTRDHYHVPPQPGEERVIDAVYPDAPNDVLRMVLESIEKRIHDIWATTDLVFPSEYEFEQEDGADYLVGN